VQAPRFPPEVAAFDAFAAQHLSDHQIRDLTRAIAGEHGIRGRRMSLGPRAELRRVLCELPPQTVARYLAALEERKRRKEPLLRRIIRTFGTSVLPVVGGSLCLSVVL